MLKCSRGKHSGSGVNPIALQQQSKFRWQQSTQHSFGAGRGIDRKGAAPAAAHTRWTVAARSLIKQAESAAQSSGRRGSDSRALERPAVGVLQKIPTATDRTGTNPCLEFPTERERRFPLFVTVRWFHYTGHANVFVRGRAAVTFMGRASARYRQSDPRRASSREALCTAIARALMTFSPKECKNFFAAAGYDRV
jgi:hypothetical protein